jgi:hypothetical protein
VIGAAQPVGFDAAEIKRRETVRTEGTDETDRTGRRAKQHQVLAEEPEAQRSAAGLAQVRRRYHRDPVLPHEITHWGRRPDARQRFVFFARKIVQIFPANFEHAFGFHGSYPLSSLIRLVSQAILHAKIGTAGLTTLIKRGRQFTTQSFHELLTTLRGKGIEMRHF